MTPLIQSNNWRTTQPPRCSIRQKYWLTRPGALTVGLREIGTFSLQVVSQTIEIVGSEDDWIGKNRVAWCREVLMSIDNTPCVLARSLTTLSASHGTWQGIRRLGRRPLADILYHDPGILRSQFEVGQIGQSHGLYRTLIRAQPTLTNVHAAPRSVTPLLARRSVFWRNHHPLMVSECFLPEFWHLTDRSGSARSCMAE